MLRDLEELLLTVPDRESREFMREAVRCYGAGLCRAAVVMAVAAGMDDLRRKLNVQAASGGAPAGAKTAANRIEATFNDQKAFEGDLIDACEREASIYGPAEAAKLRVLLKTRHLCAHPSGHASTAEEAREVIASIIDLILARPALFGMTGVSEIAARLSSAVFFPNPAQPAPTVAAEIRALQPSLHKALASKVVDLILASPNSGTFPFAIPQVRVNAKMFLVGMLHVSPETRQVVWGVLSRLIENSDTAPEALGLIADDPLGLPLAPPLTRDRALALVRRHLSTAPLRTTARAWLTSPGMLSPDEARELVTLASALVLAQLSMATPAEVAELGSAEIEQAFFAKAAENAGSSTFALSNGAVAAVQALPPDMAARMTPLHRAQYVLGVSASSEGEPHHGFEARKAVDAGLGARADFVGALSDSAAQQPNTLREARISWGHFVKLLVNAKRPDVLESVLRAFTAHEGEQNAPDNEVLGDIAMSIPSLATLAADMKTARNVARRAAQDAAPPH